MQYITSVERFAAERGRQEGRQEEALRLLLRVLSHRFGEISEAIQAQLKVLTIEQVEWLLDVAFHDHRILSAELDRQPS